MTAQRTSPTRTRVRLQPLPEQRTVAIPTPLASCRQRLFTRRWSAPSQLTMKLGATDAGGK